MATVFELLGGLTELANVFAAAKRFLTPDRRGQIVEDLRYLRFDPGGVKHVIDRLSTGDQINFFEANHIIREFLADEAGVMDALDRLKINVDHLYDNKKLSRSKRDALTSILRRKIEIRRKTRDDIGSHGQGFKVADAPVKDLKRAVEHLNTAIDAAEDALLGATGSGS